MMLVPSKRNHPLLSMMTDPFDAFVDLAASMPKPTQLLMKTDIKETEKAYNLDIDLPGYKKDDINVELKEGYLTVSASRQSATEEKDEDGTFIRKERFSGKSSRTFYVGDDVMEDNIKAKFDNGVLAIELPKKEEQPKAEEKKVISIDG